MKFTKIVGISTALLLVALGFGIVFIVYEAFLYQEPLGAPLNGELGFRHGSPYVRFGESSREVFTLHPILFGILNVQVIQQVREDECQRGQEGGFLMRQEKVLKNPEQWPSRSARPPLRTITHPVLFEIHSLARKEWIINSRVCSLGAKEWISTFKDHSLARKEQILRAKG